MTRNSYGKGEATYIGCVTSNAVTEKILADAVKNAELWGETQKMTFPIITKQGVNEKGKTIHYIFNYSSKPETVSYPFGNGKELLLGQPIQNNREIQLEPWGVKIIEEQ